MMKMHFRKLLIWQKEIELVKDVYRVTSSFPKEEIYGLISQMRRSSVSVPSNIAEGSQRTSDVEFAHFITISKGSLSELETQCVAAKELMFMKQEDYDRLILQIAELDRMLHAFHEKLVA